MMRQFADTPALFWWSVVAVLGQGLFVLALFLLARRVVPQGAEARYRLALGTLLLVAASLPATLLLAQRAVTLQLAGAGSAATAGWPGLDLPTPLGRAVPIVAAVWAMGAAFVLARLALGAWQLRRLIRSSRPAAAELHPTPVTLAQAGLREPPVVRESPVISGPFVAGWGRGVLMLPAGFARHLERAERDAVLLHELVHLRRRDFAVNLLQRVIQAVLWFEPVVWIVGTEMDRIREECCDEAVIQALGRPAILARALVRLEELRAGAEPLALAGTGGRLTARVERLLSPAPAAPDRGMHAYLALGVMAVAGTASVGSGGDWAAAITSRNVPVVTIAAEDPAGRFTLEMAGGVVRGMSVGGAAVPRERLVQSGRTLHLLDDQGRSQLDIQIRSAGAIRWIPRSPKSP